MYRKWHCYRVTNLLNGHYYIGKHNVVGDKYMGSGKAIQAAIKKYGIENFSKEVLKEFDTEAEAYQYEALLVTEKEVSDPCCYNRNLGGSFEESVSGTTSVKDPKNPQLGIFRVPVTDPRFLSGELVGVTRGRKDTPELLQKKRERNLGKKVQFSEEHRKRIAEANRRKAQDPEFRKKLQKPKSEETKARMRKPKSEEHRRKLSEANRRRWEKYRMQQLEKDELTIYENKQQLSYGSTRI